MSSENEKRINLVVASDDGYVMPLAATVRSALSNLDPEYTLQVYVLDGGISEEHRVRLEKSWQADNIVVQWLNPEGMLPDLMISGYISEATYLRLLIPQLLPETVEKVIYLDCDLIVLKDLTELWQIPIDDAPLLAAQDVSAPYVSSPMGLRLYKELGLEADAKYLNAGVLVINVALWREEAIAADIFRYLAEKREFVQFHDQDGLNAILSGRWKVLDSRWNQMSQIFGYASWEASPFDQSTFEKIVKDPFIVHYSSSHKPWQSEYTNRNRTFFFRYLDDTDWRGWRPAWNFRASLPGKIWQRISTVFTSKGGR